MRTSQSWKVFYADTRHQTAKMTLVWNGENLKKPASKGKNIFSNGFIHEKVTFEKV